MAKGGRRRSGKGGGWGVPFPKVARRPSAFSQTEQGQRTEEDLLRLQAEWAAGYTARVRAHAVLGLSMGTPLDDVEEHYHLLAGRLPAGDPRQRELARAFELIQSTAEVAITERSFGHAPGPNGREGQSPRPGSHPTAPSPAPPPITPRPTDVDVELQ